MKKNIFRSFSKVFQISKIIIKHPVFKNIFLILLILTLLGTWRIKKDTPTILSQTHSSSQINPYDDFHLLITKIKIDAPIIADVDGTNKDIYFKALENGVAQFKGTAKPGEGSNIFIFGHSSFYADQPGDYKEIFRDLENLEKDDEIVIWYQRKEYRYKVVSKKIVEPEDIDVLNPTPTEQVSLMTCVPPGTTLHRLIVIAKPVF